MGFELDLSRGELTVLTLVLLLLAVAAATPGAGLLAYVGTARARQHGSRGVANGLWYWLWGTALTWATMLGATRLGLDWWSVPLGWLPAWLAAWLLRPAGRPERQQSELRL